MGNITEGTMYLAAVYAMYESGEEMCLYSAGGYDLCATKAIAEGVARRMSVSPAAPSNIIQMYGDVVEVRMDSRKAATVYKATFDRTGKMIDVDYSIDNW